MTQTQSLNYSGQKQMMSHKQQQKILISQRCSDFQAPFRSIQLQVEFGKEVRSVFTCWRSSMTVFGGFIDENDSNSDDYSALYMKLSWTLEDTLIQQECYFLCSEISQHLTTTAITALQSSHGALLFSNLSMLPWSKTGLSWGLHTNMLLPSQTGHCFPKEPLLAQPSFGQPRFKKVACL